MSDAAQLTNNRILAVDDEQVISDYYHDILSPKTDLGKNLLDEFLSDSELAHERGATIDFEVSLFAQGEEAVEAVRASVGAGRTYAMAFIDMRMPPGIDGLKTAIEIRKIDPYIQIVIATAYSDHGIEEIQRELGIDTLFLKKPFTHEEVYLLACALCETWDKNRHLRMTLDALRESNRELEQVIEENVRIRGEQLHLQHYDSLTGLLNRSQFLLEVKSAVEAARAAGLSCGVILMSLDELHEVQQSGGIEQSEQMLVECSRLLRDFFPGEVLLSHLGTEIFGCLLSATTHQELEQLLEQLSGVMPDVEVSIGVDLLRDDHLNQKDLLTNAFGALHVAQQDRGSAWRFFDGAAQQEMVERIELKKDLRLAVREMVFELYYQPKIDIATGEVSGMEALMRWPRRGDGMVSPVRFIPLAEETGLIQEMGEWALREALLQIAEWNRGRAKPLKMAVNLSPIQFTSPVLVERVRQLMEETAVRGEWLELEVTESLLLGDHQQVIEMLIALGEMGISIALDDFGTGYSSLSYLERFPIDTLKIDSSFVFKVLESRRHADLVRAIVAMAKALDFHIVAEGVESEAHLQFLQQLGCDTAQGYLYSRPLPAPELEPRLVNEGPFGYG